MRCGDTHYRIWLAEKISLPCSYPRIAYLLPNLMTEPTPFSYYPISQTLTTRFKGLTQISENWANIGRGIYSRGIEPSTFQEDENREYEVPTLVFSNETYFENNFANAVSSSVILGGLLGEDVNAVDKGRFCLCSIFECVRNQRHVDPRFKCLDRGWLKRFCRRLSQILRFTNFSPSRWRKRVCVSRGSFVLKRRGSYVHKCIEIRKKYFWGPRHRTTR